MCSAGTTWGRVPVGPPLVYDFSLLPITPQNMHGTEKNMSTVGQWLAYVQTFATPVNFDSMLSTHHPNHPNMWGLDSQGDIASLSYTLPDNYNTVHVRFGNSFHSGTVSVSLCRTSGGWYACQVVMSAATFEIHHFSSLYLPGDTLLIDEAGGVIDNSLRITVTLETRAGAPFAGVCVECNASTYKALVGDHACTPCPAFSHHALMMQTRGDACVCQIGYVWNATTQGCSECAAGTFNNRAGDVRCFQCVSSVQPSEYPELERMAKDRSLVGGWRLVRFLPALSTEWSRATDGLAGTQVFGKNSAVPGNGYQSGSWSVLFGEFDEYLFLYEYMNICIYI